MPADRGHCGCSPRNSADLAQVSVGEAVLLALSEAASSGTLALDGSDDGFLLLDQLLHLLEEVMLDLGQLVDLIDVCALAQCLVDDELALAGRIVEHGEQLLLGLVVEVLCKAQTVAAGLQGTDGLLEGLLIGLADAHDLADGTHLRAELVLGALELLKCPAGELDDDIIAVGNVLVQGAVLAAGDLVQGQAAGQHGGYQCDREAGRLGSQCGGTGGSGVDLDDDDSAGDRIMCKLAVAAADDLNLVNDAVGLLLQTLLNVLGDGQHRSGAEGIAGVNAHGVDILDEADRDHVALGITDDLQLQLFPAGDGLLNENLSRLRMPAGLGRRRVFSSSTL